MSNYTRNNLTGFLAPVNVELEKIENALKDKLDRLPSLGQANHLTEDLDVNGQRILNVPDPSDPTDLVRLKDLSGVTSSGSDNNNKLPPQAGQAGEYLRTDGENAYWDVIDPAGLLATRPEDFGAVGDGVTDDTSALQAAIDSVKGEGALGLPTGYVELDAKTYMHTGLEIDRAVAIVGVDRNASRLKCLTTALSAVNVVLSHDGNNFQVGGRPGPTVALKNLTIESDKSFATTNRGVQVSTATSNDIRGWVYIEDVDIHAMGGDAIYGSSWEGAIKATNCKFINNGGKQLNATSCADWQFVGCEFGVTPDDNILLSGCAAFTFTTCNIYSSTGDLVTLFTDAASTAPVNHHFVSCSFDRSSEGHGVVYNVRNSGNVTFTNCYWTYNGQGAPETYSDIWIDSSVRRGPSLVGGWMQSAADSDSLYNIFFNGALSSCYTTGVQFEAGNARSANVTNSLPQLKFEGAENFATLGDAQASTWAEDGDKVTIVSRNNAGYLVRSSGYSPVTGDTTTANGLVLQAVREHIDADRTYNIPTHFATLQEGVDFILTGFTSSPDAKFNLNIESGHQPSSGIVVKNADCGNIFITSDDATVTLAAGFTGGSVETTAANCFICGDNATMPTLACLVDADDQCNAGYFPYNNSKGNVSQGCGVINCYEFGLYCANSSTLNGVNANFSGAGRGNRYTTASNGMIQGIDLSGVRGTFPLSEGYYFALDVSRGSFVNVMSQASAGSVSNLSNSAGRGLSVRRSRVSASGVNVSGSGEEGIRAELGATVCASSADISGCTGRAIFCANAGSSVDANGASMDNCGASRAIECVDGGIVSASSSSIVNASGDAIFCDKAATVNASDAVITSPSGDGLYSSNGGKINASGATITNAGNRGAFANAGGDIKVVGGTITGSSVNDLRIQRGSVITASDCTTTNGVGAPAQADTNLPALNTLYSNGVIYG